MEGQSNVFLRKDLERTSFVFDENVKTHLHFLEKESREMTPFSSFYGIENQKPSPITS